MTAPAPLETAREGLRRQPARWLLDRLVSPPRWNRSALGGAIVLLVLGVGVVDHRVGLNISLVVFYLVPVTLATTWFGGAAGIVTATACVMTRLWGDGLSQPAGNLPAWLWWNGAASFVVFVLLVWVLDTLLTTYRHLERRVQDRTAELEREIGQRRWAQSELLAASARERRAIGQELHDHVAQHLTATAMAAEVLAASLGQRKDPAETAAREIVALVGEGIDQARRLAEGLLLAEIDPGQLGSQLAELCRAKARIYPGVEFDCQVSGEPHVGDAATAAQLYRIAQEAMRNAARHSGGRRVTLRLTGDDRQACLVVEDQGRGLPPPDRRREGAMGLRIMHHRALSIGAVLNITAPPGGGTRIECILPSHSSTDST